VGHGTIHAVKTEIFVFCFCKGFGRKRQLASVIKNMVTLENLLVLTNKD
jgi:hypothetical protein